MSLVSCLGFSCGASVVMPMQIKTRVAGGESIPGGGSKIRFGNPFLVAVTISARCALNIMNLRALQHGLCSTISIITHAGNLMGKAPTHPNTKASNTPISWLGVRM